MLGAISGDIIGSRFEFSNCKSKEFELFTEESKFTDDTVCTVAILDALLNKKDPAKTLAEWCRKYPELSYGDSFRKWFSSETLEPYKSYGNGSAMRVSSVGWFANNMKELKEYCSQVTNITHNHIEGFRGAIAVAYAIYMTRQEIYSRNFIRERIQVGYGYDLSKSVDEIRENYKFNETCQGTVSQALVCFFEANDFEDAIRNAISIGGDSDTVAAITGSIAEAQWGIPNNIRDEVWRRLPEDIKEVLTVVYRPENWVKIQT